VPEKKLVDPEKEKQIQVIKEWKTGNINEIKKFQAIWESSLD